MNTFEEFDKYVEQNNVQPEDLGEAFAKFLTMISNGKWDGSYKKIV